MPALAALALFVVWATSQAGYPVTHWAPGGLIVLVLLAIALAIVRAARRGGAAPGEVALGALAAYTALSYLSILWAAVPGDAWEGANRTLLYLLVFALFACWRQRGASAALLLCAWTLAMIALAAFAALHLDAAGAARACRRCCRAGAWHYPSGYPNANAAQWLMAFWPALLLARSERLPWGLRGLLAGGAVLLAEVALLSQSRGSLYATPVMLVLVFALLPGRTRTFALLVPVAARHRRRRAGGAARRRSTSSDEAVTADALHSATRAIVRRRAGGRRRGGRCGAALESRAERSRRGRTTAPADRRSRARDRSRSWRCSPAGSAAAGNPVTRVETRLGQLQGRLRAPTARAAAG